MPAADEATQRSLMAETIVRYQSMILAYAFSILRDCHLAEDVYQEVVAILARRWDDLDHDEKLGAWLKETTRRKSLEALRKHRRVPVTLPEDALDAVGDELVHQQEDDRERERLDGIFQLLHQCLDKLGDAAKTVLRLRYGGDTTCPCEDIARTMKRSVRAVYALMKRARMALARCVEQGGFSVGTFRG